MPAGAGHLIVGAVNYSDYPEQARDIPQIGGYNNFNVELILSSQPDLIIAWREGNQKQQVEQLIELGLTVYINAPRQIEDIDKTIRQFGILSGNSAQADIGQCCLLTELNALRSQYSGLTPVSTFYQVWHEPLITVNDEQLIGQAIKLCSGKNIFTKLTSLTPQVSVEAVLASDPQVIIVSGHGEPRPEWLEQWQQWSFLQAVKKQQLFLIPPETIQRQTSRILAGTRLLCEHLQQVREQKFRQ